jgi:UDP-N-acetylglucosamine--N-acetylmuramyl-(pentapeptide) pyrophosphoryl-undecaprenol N-acetylglucosamine transferase
MVVVFYALNGVGLGHVKRLTAIANALRAAAAEEGISVTSFFITTSESDHLLYKAGYACFKVPSRRAVEQAGCDLSRFRDIAVNVVQNIIDNLRPDLLVVDTAPSGSFGEFAPSDGWDLTKHCRRTALVLRPVRRSVAEVPSFGAALARYDRVLVPEHESSVDSFIVESVPRDRLRFIGPIHSRSRNEMPSRNSAREALDVREGILGIYVSTGGGGYKQAESQMRAICRGLSGFDNVKLLVTPGPLYRGSIITHPRVVWCEPQSADNAMAAADIAVSAAGYNSFYELMAGHIPTIFIPLPASTDDQTARALRAVHAGAAQVLPVPFRDEDLQEAVSLWFDETSRSVAANASIALATTNCAPVAARELLSLLTGEQ